MLCILRRHRILILAMVGCVMFVTALAVFTATPIYQATATVRVELISGSGDSQLENAAQNEARMETEARLYASRVMAEAVIKDLFLLSDPEFMPPDQLLPRTEKPSDRSLADAVDKMRDMVIVTRAPRAEFIDITVRSPSPALAARIANQYVDTLQDTRSVEKRKKQRNLVAAIGTEVDRVKSELATAEKAVSDFRSSHQMLAGSAGVDDLAQINRVAAEAASAGSVRAELTARSAGVSRAAAMQSAATATSALLQQQQRQYDDLLREKAKLTSFYGSGHPDVANVDAQLSEMQANMSKERIRVSQAAATEAAAEATRANSEASGAAAREAQLRGFLGSLTSKAYQNNKDNVTLMSLEREAETTRELYLSLVSRLKTETAALAGTGVMSSLLSRAPLPTEPVSPTPTKTLATAFSGSLFLSFLIAFSIEMFDNKLRSGKQIRRHFGLPTLAMIPRIANITMTPDASPVISDPRSLFAEVARTLYFETARRWKGEGAQVVVVTSPLPGDGKSTVALSLTAAAAAKGQRAVIIDLDLRRDGLLQEIQKQMDGPDLVEYLQSDMPFGRLLPHAYDDSETSGKGKRNIKPFVLSAHGPVDDPASLISMSRLQQLFDELRQHFDLIVVNSPATLAVCDARSISGISDTALMVVDWGRTTIDQARAALEILEYDVAGVVFNKVDYVEHARRGYGDAIEYYTQAAVYYRGEIPAKYQWITRWKEAGKAWLWSMIRKRRPQ
ncbi:Wzz/FepE/Etk N-terminal domain-containing protein [Rhizorhapis sp. SPR117]|nr:Wzz/FepE/Etk N-terminal domain-containing protein [Rhizorhapis sp. SPR117]